MKAIYPASFDPITNGHLDIIERASKLVKQLYVVISINPEKKYSIESIDRSILVGKSLSHLKNVNCFNCNGLISHFAKAHKINYLIRGLRTNTDFEQELVMAQINKELNPSLETIFIPTDYKKSFVSSSMVRQLIDFGEDISKFVPKPVQEYFRKNDETI